MRKYKVFNVPFFVFVFILFAINLTACSRKSNHSVQGGQYAQFSRLSEKVNKCELKIREQMLNKSLSFQVTSEISDQMAQGFAKNITEANRILPLLTETEYGIVQLNNEVSAVNVNYKIKNNSDIHYIEYSLEVAKDSQNAQLNLTNTYQVRKINQEYISIDQVFLVNEDCDRSLIETSFATLKDDKNKYLFNKKSIYYNGESSSKESEYVYSDKSRLKHVGSYDDLITLKPNSTVLLDEIGFAEFNREQLENNEIKSFGLVLNFTTYEINFLLSDTTGISYLIEVDLKNKIVRVQFENIFKGLMIWYVPLSIWNSQALSSMTNMPKFIDSKLPTDYLKNHNSINIEGIDRPGYDNFDAYWHTSSEVFDKNNKSYKATLIENKTAKIKSVSSSEDLRSNDTIQSDLPEIQNIVKKIKIEEPDDRNGQIKKILKYLDEYYQYDYEMVKFNVIRPLTTKEALERGKGVCQHYAVIFTAIARALKIPTRIVAGFALFGELPGGHAWVEVEIEPGVWQVVETQLAQGLTETYTRFYFPVLRARFLEDKNINDVPFTIQFNLNGGYNLTPASTAD